MSVAAIPETARSVRFAGLVLFCAIVLVGLGGSAGRPAQDIVLWAWDRPENLSFADRRVSIAYVAANIVLSGADASVTPRLPPLELPPGVRAFPVIHVEADRRVPPQLNQRQAEIMIDVARQIAGSAPAAMLQIDFEALPSQQNFYAGVLREVRPVLPADTSLSITALVSWCMFEGWTASLPVDEIVPMAFRMGRGSGAQRALDRGDDLRQANCRHAIGIALDEPRRALPRGRRIYVFNPRSWDRDAYGAALTEAGRWR